MRKRQPLSIRDPKAHELAAELAARRGTNLTEATIAALESALEAMRHTRPLADRAAAIAADLAAKGKPGGRDMTQAEIDAMWQD